MKEQRLILLYQDHPAGELIRHTDGGLELRYSDDYRDAPGAVPISTSMTLDAASYKGVALENWLSGLLPDDENVLKKWRSDFGVRMASPFGLLGTPIGEDCAGAFQFIQPQRMNELSSRSNKIDWLSHADMANVIRDLKNNSIDWLGTNPHGRFSLAGAQTKTALLWDGKRWGRPNGKTATTHIVKPAIKGLDSHDLNEHLCLDAARRVGINAAITKIETFEDETALFIQRYDRALNSGEQIRVHQEDVCQAFGMHPSRKYQHEGGPSPKDIAEKMNIVIPARNITHSLEGFADALIWNWLLCAPDAHSKNYSLLIGSNEALLAPLYDIASILIYPHQRKEVHLAMKFGGGYGVDLRPSVWPVLARDLGLPEAWVRQRAGALVEAAPDAFLDAASNESILDLQSDLPLRLTDAISKRAKICRKSLDAI